jgi:multidrug efflux pump subunit AcrA (membrane-fusion protein)
MRLSAQPSRLVATLGLLALSASTLDALAQPGGDDPRGRFPSRESRSGFPSRPRDPFDTLRSAGATPADRLAVLEADPQGLRRLFDTQKPSRGDVQMTVTGAGELEAAQKADVLCQVRSHGKDSPGPTIKWLIDDGATVKKGDVVARLDDTAVRERLQTQHIVVADKEALLLEARQEWKRQAAQGQAQLNSAQSDLKIAQAALKAHTDAEDVEKRKGELKVLQAKLVVELAKLKGTDKAASLETQLAESNLALAELDAKRLQSDLALAKLLQETQVQRAKDGVEMATLKLEQGQAQARARLEAAEAAVKAEKARLADVQQDLGNCVLTAPHDGTVLYHEPAAQRRGAAQSVVAVGESVREGQKLMYIPKPGAMQVRIKVDESLVGKLEIGQRALVIIPAVQQTLAGKVQHIAPIASTQDWLTSGVRVYPTVIVLTEASAMLKPMMPAQASIFVAETKNVLRVPAQAVSWKDGAAYCFVKKEDGIHERKITPGLSGSAHVEIKEGVKEGEEVLVSVRTVPGGLDPARFGGFGGGRPEPRPDR